MRYIGIALLLLGAYTVYKKYLLYLNASYEECSAYVSLIELLYGKVSCYLAPQNEVVMHFESEALETCGFLPEMRRCGSVREAFSTASKDSRMPPEAVEALRSLFESFGTGYLDSQTRAMEICLSRLEKIIEKEKAELDTRRRVAGALTFAAAAGCALFFI